MGKLLSQLLIVLCLEHGWAIFGWVNCNVEVNLLRLLAFPRINIVFYEILVSKPWPFGKEGDSVPLFKVELVLVHLLRAVEVSVNFLTDAVHPDVLQLHRLLLVEKSLLHLHYELIYRVISLHQQ